MDAAQSHLLEWRPPSSGAGHATGHSPPGDRSPGRAALPAVTPFLMSTASFRIPLRAAGSPRACPHPVSPSARGCPWVLVVGAPANKLLVSYSSRVASGEPGCSNEWASKHRPGSELGVCPSETWSSSVPKCALVIFAEW